MKYHVIAFTFIIVVLYGCTDDSTNPITNPTTTTEPTDYPTEFISSVTTDSTITLVWKDAKSSVVPEYYFITGVQGTNKIAAPQDGISPVPGALAQVVKQGIQTVTFTKLKSDLEYTFAIYPYTDKASATNFKNDSLAPKLSVTTNQSKGIIPLKVGNEWEYDVIETNFNTRINAGGEEYSSKVVWIGKDTLMDGNKWYEVRRGGSTNSISYETNYLRSENKNVWFIGYFFARFAHPYGEEPAQYFPAIGNPPSNNGIHEIQVDPDSAHVSVTVPAGTFNCIKYKVVSLDGSDSSNNKTCYYYIAPTVGIVKVSSRRSYEEIYPETGEKYMIWLAQDDVMKSVRLK